MPNKKPVKKIKQKKIDYSRKAVAARNEKYAAKMLKILDEAFEWLEEIDNLDEAPEINAYGDVHDTFSDAERLIASAQDILGVAHGLLEAIGD